MLKQKEGHNGADLIGQKFGRLTVLARAENNKHGNRRWDCLCECGAKATPTSAKLLSGHTRSCGCYGLERITKHGMHKSSEYTIWAQMVERCYNPNSGGKYDRYGGRGIRVCDRWRESFVNFYADMGPRPSTGHTIDRKDNNGPYSPDNCKWETWHHQYRNRRQTVWVEFRGETLCQKDWCRRYNLDEATFAARLKRGWPLERALTEPAAIQRGKNAPRAQQGILLDLVKGVK